MSIEEALRIAEQHRLAGRLAESETIYRQVLSRRPDDADALHGLGVLADQVGRPDVGADLIGRAIRLRPGSAAFHNDLGKALIRGGRREDAAACFQKAVELDPSDAEAHSNLGNTLSDKKNFEKATAEYHRAIQLKPDYAEAHYNLGNALRSQQRLEEAIAAYGRAIELRPNLAEAYNNRGNCFSDLGRPEQAVAEFKKVVALRPGQATGFNNLGTALRKTSQLDAAIEALNMAIGIDPNYATALNNRGVILKEQRRHEESLASFRKAVALKPDFTEALDNLIGLLKDLGRFQEVLAVCSQVIQQKPDFAQAYNVLGGMLQELGRVDESMAACMRAIAIKPDLAEGHNNIGNAFRDQGRLDEAIESYRRALELKPESASIHSNLAYTIHFHADYDPAQILQENRQWAQRHEKPAPIENHQFANERSPNRKLKIGYVSPDFRLHCAAFFLMPLLAHHNKEQVEVFCYSGVKMPDHFTEQFMKLGHTWRDSVAMSDAELARQISADKIDILIDVALHMSGSRLTMFGQEPAPVQVTWLGYPSTTGLSSIDYRLTDPYLDPVGQGDGFYSEKSIRLPHSFWCYQPLIQTDPVSPLPALQAGHITFGCFNNFHKVTPQTLQLWSSVLQAVPRSRLIILSQPGAHRDRVRQRFEQDGISSDRIEFVARTPLENYFRLYHRVDICLDTIPYPGHTTTLDGLWMGVPVITMTGRTAVSRGGLSILTNVGLPDLIAHTPDQVVAIARRITTDLPALAELRGGLRQQLQSSPLMNARQFAADLEYAFREMWIKWCSLDDVRASNGNILLRPRPININVHGVLVPIRGTRHMMKLKQQFEPIPWARPAIDDSELQAVIACMKSGWLTSGPRVAQFEEKMSVVAGRRHGIAVSNGTAALDLALRVLGIGREAEVIVPAFSYVATASTVAILGATPVFADIDPRNLGMDPASVETCISSRTRAILCTDYGGNPCDYKRLATLAQRHHLPLLLDGAQSIGSMFGGKPTLSQGMISTVSFHAAKTITTVEGGMVFTDDVALAARMRIIRSQGEDPQRKYHHIELGHNFRMTELQAAIGLAQLEKLDALLEHRRLLAERYRDEIGPLDLPMSDGLPGARNSYFLFPLLIPRRDRVVNLLKERGIDTRVCYPLPLYDQPIFSQFKTGRCPVTEQVCGKIINLPMFHGLTPGQQQRIVSELAAALPEAARFAA